MPELTRDLEIIRAWLARHDKRVVYLLQPGLDRADVDRTSHYLPFRLPDEVYELYAWRNGTRPDPAYTLMDMAVFNGVQRFLPLEEALQYQKDIAAGHESFLATYPDRALRAVVTGRRLFPLFSDDGGGVFYTVCAATPRQTGAIVECFGAGEEPRLAFQSLSEMITRLRELYDRGIAGPFLE